MLNNLYPQQNGCFEIIESRIVVKLNKEYAQYHDYNTLPINQSMIFLQADQHTKHGSMCLKSILVLFSVISYALSIQFHLEKQTKIGNLGNDVRSIQIVNDSLLGIIQGTPSQSQLIINSGPNLDQQLHHLYYSQLKQLPKIGLAGVVTLKQTDQAINIQEILEQNSTYRSQEYLGESGMLLVEDTSIYISQKDIMPTLLHIDIQSKTKKQLHLSSSAFQYIGCLSDMNSQLLLYTARSQIFIIEKHTQQVVYNFTIQTEISHASTQFDPSTNTTTLVVHTGFIGRYYVYTYDHTNNEHKYITQIFNPTSYLLLTGPFQAISFGGSLMYRHRDINKNVLIKQYGYDHYMGYQRRTIGITKDEKYFILREYLSSVTNYATRLLFYTINTSDYSIHNQFNITYDGQDSLNLYSHTGVFSEDGETIFMIYQRQGSRFGVCKVNITDKKIEKIMDEKNATKDEDCLAVGIVSSSGDGQFVTVCKVQEVVGIQQEKQSDQTITSLYIHVRKISDLSLIDSLKLVQLTKYYQANILANQKWNSTFIIQLRQITDVFNITDECLTTVYRVVDNKIIATQISSNEISFQRVHATEKYVVSMKYTKDRQRSGNYLKIFNYDALSLAKSIYYPPAYLFGRYRFLGEGDVVVVTEQLAKGDKVDVYDLGVSADQSPRGSFFSEYFASGSAFPSDSDWIMFPRRGMLYWYNIRPGYSPIYSTEPLKLIYNIAHPPIYQVVNLIQPNGHNPATPSMQSPSTPQIYLYIKPQYMITLLKIANAGQHCFYKTQHCTNLLIASHMKAHSLCSWTLNIDTLRCFLPSKLDHIFRLFFASDHKHVIIRYNISSSQCFIQIRPLAGLTQKIWSYSTVNQSIHNVDVTSQGNIIISFSNQVKIIKIAPKQSASKYQLDQFDTFDTNSKGCFAFAGIIVNQTKHRIIFKVKKQDTNFSYYDYQTIKIKLVILSQDCLLLGAITQDQNLLILQIVQNSLTQIFHERIPGIISIKFINNLKIAVQTTTGLIIRDIIPSYRQNRIGIQIYQEGNINYVISPDGTLLAKTVDNTIMQIAQTESQKVVGRFSIKNVQNKSVITGMAFQSDKTLQISSNNSNLYTLTPASCPQTYVNTDSICYCRGNSTQTKNRCQCNKNFIDNKKQCICPQQFQYANNQCQCREGSYQYQNQCLCYKNYVKIGFECVCPQSFQISQNKCECNGGYVQNQQCHSCNLLCSNCTGPGLNCSQYSWIFFVIISVLVLIAIGLIVLAIYCLKKRRRQNPLQDKFEDDDKVERTDSLITPESRSNDKYKQKN